MADPQARAKYLAVHGRRAHAEADLGELTARVGDLRDDLAAAGGATANPDLAHQLADAEAQAAAAAAALAALDSQAAELRRAAVGDDEFGLLDQKVPVLLLPVRLEVRA